MTTVERLADSGLDLPTFLAEVEQALAPAVPHVALCVSTLDPTSGLITGAHKFGDLTHRSERDMEWALVEYGDSEATTFATLATAQCPANSIHLGTNGDPDNSRRWREVVEPYFGYGDELRVVARDERHNWGGFALFRSHDDVPFTDQELGVAARLSHPLATGLRLGAVVSAAASPPPPQSPGPSVVIVDEQDVICQVSMPGDDEIDRFLEGIESVRTSAILGGLVARARLYARGAVPDLPSATIRLTDGRWVVAQAAPLAARGRPGCDIAVTVVEAGPSVLVPMVVQVLGLTTREREIVDLVLGGRASAEISRVLSLSPYTVQDHLKSIFEKAGVHSRRELVTRVLFEHHLPRLVQSPGPPPC